MLRPKLTEQDLQFIYNSYNNSTWNINHGYTPDGQAYANKTVTPQNLVDEIRRQRVLIQELVDKILMREGL